MSSIDIDNYMEKLKQVYTLFRSATFLRVWQNNLTFPVHDLCRFQIFLEILWQWILLFSWYKHIWHHVWPIAQRLDFMAILSTQAEWTGMRWNGTAIINWNYQNVLEGHWTEPFSSASFHSIALLSAGSIPDHSRTFQYTSDDVNAVCLQVRSLSLLVLTILF